MIVWDQAADPPAGSREVVFWRTYASDPAVLSIPRYVEDHAGRLRAAYLALIHDIGEYRVGSRRVLDHLDRGDGFSFWWMTTVAEKSPFKSPGIYSCLRLMALEDILRERRPSNLRLVTGDRALVRAVRRLCGTLGIPLVYQRGRADAGASRPRRLYNALPYPAQALLSLVRHLIKAWPLRRLPRPPWASGERAVFFCSYFVHLDAGACAAGEFVSRQWPALPRLLNGNGYATNWLHHFLISPAVPDVRTALSWAARFNRDSGRQGAHGFVSTYLTVGLVAQALWQWLALCAAAWRLRAARQAFVPIGSAAWLWPFLRHDWLSSLTGPTAVHNCLWVALFDRALSEVPRQPIGFYLCENQGWERALLQAWRRHGHGEIIAVQHATVPFWHLCYFDDPRTLQRSRPAAMPMPDRMAVNGPAARRAFEDAGYPADGLVDVEALRYLDQIETPVNRIARERPSGCIRVLVVGDLIPTATQLLLTEAEVAAQQLTAGYAFTFRPHPGFAPVMRDFPSLRLDPGLLTLDQLLGGYDVVVAANSTSSAVEAYQKGLPVIVVLDGGALNLSPLRGLPAARFVGTAGELAQALAQAARQDPGRAGDFGCFFRDPALPRWQQLLADVMLRASGAA